MISFYKISSVRTLFLRCISLTYAVALYSLYTQVYIFFNIDFFGNFYPPPGNPPPINFVLRSHMNHKDIFDLMAEAPGPLACPSRGARPLVCPSRRAGPPRPCSNRKRSAQK